MRNISKVLVVIAVIAAIAIVITVTKAGKEGGNSSIPPQNSDGQTAQTQQPMDNIATSKIHQAVRQPLQSNLPPRHAVIVGATNPMPVSSKTTSAGLIADWDEKVNDILGPEGDEKEKAKKLIELFPHLPPDGQEEVAHHISNLVADEDYAPLSQFVTNSALPEAVLDVFVEDVFNRPNAIKLPLLLDIAQDPQHPRASEAKDVLELFLEEDFGSDWTKWHAKMDQWLKDNPD